MTITLYESVSPEVEASGASIQTVLRGMATDLKPLLLKHGLQDVKADTWYPQQQWLSFFKDVAESGGGAMMDLVSIGMQIAEVALLPPHIDSVEKALASMNDAYHMNNRNDSPERGWTFEKKDDNHYTLVCRTAVPRDFEYGVVYGFVKRFKPEGKGFIVKRAEQDDGSCVFEITLD
jgi:hypothetical protein